MTVRIPYLLLLAALSLTACAAPRLDDAQLTSITPSTADDTQRLLQARELWRRNIFLGASFSSKDGPLVTFEKEDYDAYRAYLELHPLARGSELKTAIDWPRIRISFRTHRELVAYDPTSLRTAYSELRFCNPNISELDGFLSAGDIMWRGEFLTAAKILDVRHALQMSGSEEYEIFLRYTHRDVLRIPRGSQSVTLLPPPEDLCLSRVDFGYATVAGKPLRIDKALIMEALKPLPRTLALPR